MSVNVDLLRRTLAHIEQHPAEWNQRLWRCDSSMCFAGWAATLAGGEWATLPDEQGENLLVADAADEADPMAEVIPENDWDYSLPVRTVPVSDRAQRILGLTRDQRLELFQGANTLDDLRRIVGELCDGAQ